MPVLPFTLTTPSGDFIAVSPNYVGFDPTPFVPAFDPDDDWGLEWYYNTDGHTWIDFEEVNLWEMGEHTGMTGDGKQWALFFLDQEHPELLTRLSNIVTLP